MATTIARTVMMTIQTEWLCPLCHTVTDEIVVIDSDVYNYEYICYDCSHNESPPISDYRRVPSE